MNILENAIQNANHFVGEKEKPGNQGFYNKELDNYMKMVGFQLGWAYCSLFAELCWSRNPYHKKAFLFPHVRDNCSANAVRTYENFKNDTSGKFIVSKDPKPGAIVIWEKRRDGEPIRTSDGVWTLGHAGIVIDHKDENFNAIEANTNEAGSRTGDGIYHKTREYNFFDKDGLCLLGFIYPTNEWL